MLTNGAIFSKFKHADPHTVRGSFRGRKTFNVLQNIVSLLVWVDVSRFSPCVINLSRSKHVCCRLKKVTTSRARVYFEQQILVLLLVFHQTYNLSCNKFAHVAREVEGFVISFCISPRLLSCGSLVDSLLQLSFVHLF